MALIDSPWELLVPLLVLLLSGFVVLRQNALASRFYGERAALRVRSDERVPAEILEMARDRTEGENCDELTHVFLFPSAWLVRFDASDGRVRSRERIAASLSERHPLSSRRLPCAARAEHHFDTNTSVVTRESERLTVPSVRVTGYEETDGRVIVAIDGTEHNVDFLRARTGAGETIAADTPLTEAISSARVYRSDKLLADADSGVTSPCVAEDRRGYRYGLFPATLAEFYRFHMGDAQTFGKDENGDRVLENMYWSCAPSQWSEVGRDDATNSFAARVESGGSAPVSEAYPLLMRCPEKHRFDPGLSICRKIE